MQSALEALLEYEETASPRPTLWAIHDRTSTSVIRRESPTEESPLVWPVGIYFKVEPAAAVDEEEPRLSALERLRERASRVMTPMTEPQIADSDFETDSSVESFIVVGTDQLPELTEEWE